MIEILFSCQECGVHRKKVPVAERDNQSVTDWLEQVAAKGVSEMHAILSPLCRCQKISEMMIPATSSKGIGFAPLPGDDPKQIAEAYKEALHG